MLKLTADFILHPSGQLVDNHTLLIEESGIIRDLIEGVETGSEYHQGILCPGFINTHCHLELSHLKNIIPKAKKLHGFISDIIQARKFQTNNIHKMSEDTDQHMWNEGIQAVGDICNTADSFEIKKKSRIRYHSFIELFNFRQEEASKTFSLGQDLIKSAIQSKLNASIVPHAPYSVPPQLLELIFNQHQQYPSLWSIHNQETASENEMFLQGKGALIELFHSMGFDMEWFHPTGENSISSISNFFPDKSNLLFVHNTFTSNADIEFLKSTTLFNHSWFCLCPKANLYIENRLPDINMLFHSGCSITIGTDSLASNDSLSILEELKTIHLEFPEIPIQNLLNWATRNGAKYFGWNDLGSFKINTEPGVLLISNANRSIIEKNCAVKRLF